MVFNSVPHSLSLFTKALNSPTIKSINPDRGFEVFLPDSILNTLAMASPINLNAVEKAVPIALNKPTLSIVTLNQSKNTIIESVILTRISVNEENPDPAPFPILNALKNCPIILTPMLNNLNTIPNTFPITLPMFVNPCIKSWFC